jgi:hypothetical protein
MGGCPFFRILWLLKLIKVLESRAFIVSDHNLANPTSLAHLYFQNSLNSLDAHLKQLTTGIRLLLKTLKTKATVHYYDPTSNRMCVAERMASMLNLEMASIDYEDISQVIILDRNVDLFSPFIHSMTYEASCYDLFDVDSLVVK